MSEPRPAHTKWACKSSGHVWVQRLDPCGKLVWVCAACHIGYNYWREVEGAMKRDAAVPCARCSCVPCRCTPVRPACPPVTPCPQCLATPCACQDIAAALPPCAPPLPKAHALFEEAEATISGPRRGAYGDAKASFTRVANSWSEIIGHKLTAQQVALMMIAFKVCREANAHKHDNVVDICGYAGLLAELEAGA